MAPKNTNAKKEQGKARKAENETKKGAVAAANAEKKEAQSWEDGAKTGKGKEDKEAKRLAELARKAENARLLASEESSVASAKPKPTKDKKKTQTPAGPGSIAAGGGIASTKGKEVNERPDEPEAFAATGIDDALDLLSIVNSKGDKASVGQAAAGIERHPERRFKAAYEAFQERELPQLKIDHPGLRLQQYKDLLYKQFQKSPDNPFNQVLVGYDASKDERVAALEKQKEATTSRLRQ